MLIIDHRTTVFRNAETNTKRNSYTMAGESPWNRTKARDHIALIISPFEVAGRKSGEGMYPMTSYEPMVMVGKFSEVHT